MYTLNATSAPTNVKDYTKHFIEHAPFRIAKDGHSGLRNNTLRNYHNFLTIWEKFERQNSETVELLHLDQSCIVAFKQWLLNDCAYSVNNASRLMSTLKTIALDAQKSGYPTHPYVNFIKSFRVKQQDKIIHTLSFREIEKIEKTKVPAHLERTKKWLLIGCWVGQRVSDLLTLTPDQIRPAKNKGLYVDFLQQKTSRKVTVGVINPMAIHILTQDFPKRMYPERFNKQLKLVLKEAGLTQMVKAHRYNGKTKRKETGIFPKYAIIASHDLRRSFATNFYGKIPTPILMNMTGHARETSFLTYIGMDQKRDSFADAFMQGVAKMEL